MPNLPYTDKVMEHFKHPRNVGRIENPDGKATEGSPACGDMVSVYIKVDDRTKKLSDIKFESYGCASNIATGSIITELARGKTLEEAKNITWQEASEALGGLPKIKSHCSVLAVEGLRSAIQNYEERYGLITEREPTTVEGIRKRLKKVINPISGLDVMRTNLVKDISLNEGRVTIDLDLPQNHQFAPAIQDEIKEKIEPLWDVKEVVINYTD
ncbi:NifU family protein [Dehalogenimonas formicexedens]|uniref:NifU family protein n=1 Tax=Dehalogenimonas formicexedens TaxID=1839801 RepID=A0A1P8F4T8_9CHLR|nr:iron-sulfur cluster assembly scaffold protein [Dehalogenimonas formicexedens]APV43465.1 NifU family protein [Dehalogenimonas formicexedens]